MLGAQPQSIDFAIRLADEGVPLRAIARATKIPSDELRLALTEAVDVGKLIELPRDDWPIGFPRDQRALQLSRMLSEDHDATMLAVRRVFKITRSETTLLLALLQSEQVSKFRPDMAAKPVDVYVCRLRKVLKPWDVEIDTLWGYGYKIEQAARRRIMDVVFTAVREPAPAVA